jgi:Flp pilus assembly pilin Flp
MNSSSRRSLLESLAMRFRLLSPIRSSDRVSVVQNRITQDDGQDLIEYALLAAVLSVGCILSIQAVAGGVIPFFDRVIAAFSSL